MSERNLEALSAVLASGSSALISADGMAWQPSSLSKRVMTKSSVSLELSSASNDMTMGV